MIAKEYKHHQTETKLLTDRHYNKSKNHNTNPSKSNRDRTPTLRSKHKPIYTYKYILSQRSESNH